VTGRSLLAELLSLLYDDDEGDALYVNARYPFCLLASPCCKNDHLKNEQQPNRICYA
jgi:hypothetical protein